MSSLKQFQQIHGGAWEKTVLSECFAAAVSLATAEKIEKITALSDDEIAMRGPIILADLRGHLLYETALLGLHDRKELVFSQLGPEEYPDPIEEALEEERFSGEPPDDSDAFQPQPEIPSPRKSPQKKKKRPKKAKS